MAEANPTTPAPSEDAAALEAAVEAGKASLDGGKGIPYERVRRWLLSWGTSEEALPPK
jgi:predicted transcriptional regulator